MKRTAIALVALLPLAATADEGDDTLRFMLAKSDLVVLGKIVSEPEAIFEEEGVANYPCDFAVEGVLKGEATFTNTRIKVNIKRFENDERDHHPLIAKDSCCILFLKRRSEGTVPPWVTSDFWFGVQHPFPWLARSLIRKRDSEDRKTREVLRERYVEARTREEWLKASERFVADLKARYAGIDASVRGPAAVEHDVRFTHLMREWNPVLCTVDDLKSIAGKPTNETPQSVEYVFDNGEDACAWKFTLTTDIVTGIEYIPGE